MVRVSMLVFLSLVGQGTASVEVARPATPTRAAAVSRSLPSKAWRQSRKVLNLSSTFGSATKASPYDRIAGHPVFSVTTAWGSPYMSMEKLSDLNEVVQENTGAGRTKPQSISEEQSEYRTVALYFLDPDDALAVHGEMKQMEQMQNVDIRVTSFSLAKALRQASNLGSGLVTGAPPDPLDGTIKASEGGALRYKLVPPKRQLYYAARCIGKERVGLFGDTATQDAMTAVMGNSAIEGTNLGRRRDKRERKTPQSKTAMQQQNAHMEGYVGIPVFYAPTLRKSLPLVKQVLSGSRHETPLFFNYEDLEATWRQLRERNPRLPEQPEQVEVFNLWDVLTSMDKEAATNKRKAREEKFSLTSTLKASLRRLAADMPGLQHITFIPSSRSVQYKESISARGNSKARLRPMRAW
jgi:peptidoglycan hydrolase-like protein with peptidoglycan-binding domain